MNARMVCCTFLFVLTQSPAVFPENKSKPRMRLAMTGDEVIQSSALRSSHLVSRSSTGPGDSICFTFYEIGTNGSPLRNLINYGDGNLFMARMAAHDSLTLQRGAFRSCSANRGLTWEPCSGPINPTRTGWATVDHFVEAGGNAVIVEHLGVIHVESARCSNAWSTNASCLYLWPRVAVGGGYTVHTIFSPTSPPSQLMYCRSLDAGTTWETPIAICTHPGIFQDADSYDIAAQGSNVTVVCAGAGGDVVLARSTDAGENWMESIIYDIDETLMMPDQVVPDGSCGLILDDYNNPHVVWGTYQAPGDGQLYLSTDAGIMYWNEDSGIQTIALSLNDSTICVPGCRDGNYATGPDIGRSLDGALYVIYSQVVPPQDSSGNCYQHVYSVGSTDLGLKWAEPVDITPGAGFDATYPSLADLVDDDLHLVYNCDPIPGCNDPFPALSDRGSVSPIALAIKYLRIPVTSVVDVSAIEGATPSRFALRQNYPNPFNSVSEIQLNVSEYAFVRLTVFDLLGREIAALVNGPLPPGRYTRQFDAREFPTGVYFYKLEAGTYIETRKMVLLR